ncbi:MAG: RDD family protein [Myxococcaceae bacterium]|nr:RDD family protein [Myxococcaceae bacterium]
MHRPVYDVLTQTVATPERVALELPVAGVGSRTGAYLIDFAALGLFWVAVFFVVSMIDAEIYFEARALSGLLQGLIILGVFATQWVYWTACEVLWGGQTLGKRVVGIRVVREDGAPVGFFDSAVRNLLRLIDFLPAFYALGVVTMLVTKQHRRLGDIAAGTLLIREVRVDLDRYVTAQPASAAGAAVPNGPIPLSAQDTELVLSFLERSATLAPDARQRLAASLVHRIGAALPEAERAAIAASWESSERFLRERLRPGA